MSRSPRIYVVDDDPEILRGLEKYLGEAGFEARTASDGTGLLGVLQTFQPDLIILDLGLPGDDGLTLTRWIREASDVPVIMLTGRVEDVDRIVGLELGADDYMTKPFNPRELLARIKAVLRRASRTERDDRDSIEMIEATAVGFAGWEFDLAERRLVSPSGEKVKLTRSEFNLLVTFVAAPQRVLSRGELVAFSRKYIDKDYETSINALVFRLRQKLAAQKLDAKDKGAEIIETRYGSGYVFTPIVERLR
jgi:DNA-binding response OmpR family regulator